MSPPAFGVGTVGAFGAAACSFVVDAWNPGLKPAYILVWMPGEGQAFGMSAAEFDAFLLSAFERLGTSAIVVIVRVS